MARYKIQPIEVRTQNTAPYMIAEIGDNEKLEETAEKLSYLCSKYPSHWSPSITKLPSFKRR